jgi:hypothetical protein
MILILLMIFPSARLLPRDQDQDQDQEQEQEKEITCPAASSHPFRPAE